MFFPIKDYNPTRRIAYITILIIIANIALFLYQAVFSNLEFHIARHAMIPWEVTHLETIDSPIGYTLENDFGDISRKDIYRELPPYLTLLLSLFMHGSILHLLGNMLFLWIFGNNIEDHLGPIRYLIFYLLCGVGASLVHVLFNLNSFVPVIGASGAVSGVMGAYLVLYPRARIRTLVFVFIFITFADIPASFFLIFWLIFQFFYAGGTSGIAWLAHVGGFFIGLSLIKVLRRNKPIIEFVP